MDSCFVLGSGGKAMSLSTRPLTITLLARDPRVWTDIVHSVPQDSDGLTTTLHHKLSDDNTRDISGVAAVLTQLIVTVAPEAAAKGLIEAGFDRVAQWISHIRRRYPEVEIRVETVTLSFDDSGQIRQLIHEIRSEQHHESE